MNPHQEEYQAEVRNYVLWCEGRLEELRQAGMFAASPLITEQGMIAFRKLVGAGFHPSREKIVLTLRSFQCFEEADLETVAEMLMTDPT